MSVAQSAGTPRSEAWIVDGCRTPRGRGKPDGALHGVHPQELLAQVLNQLVARTSVPTDAIEDVVVGNNSNTGDHGSCIGRMGVLAAGWPVTIPGVTINRFCGSGQQAVTFAAMGILSGMQDLVIGAGVESMSRTDRSQPLDFLAGNDALGRLHPLVPQGISADLIATLEGFGRAEVDAFAVRSQQRAASAIAQRRFARSVVPVVGADGTVLLDHDEHPRPATTVEGLAALPASFAALGQTSPAEQSRTYDEMALSVYPRLSGITHVHHAGNSSGVVDGASALLLCSPRFGQAHGLVPRARIVMTAVTGAEPVIMLTAPGPAARLCLEKAGMKTPDIDIWEINEAFAAVVLKTVRDLDISPERVNVNGGAIALGHPIGATGPILIQTALDLLEDRDQQTALIATCTGGGMATATIIERV